MKNIYKTIIAVCMLFVGTSAMAQAKSEPSDKPVKIYIVAGQSNAEQRGNIPWTQKQWPEYNKIREKLWHYYPEHKPPSPFLGETYDKLGVEFVAGTEISDAVENDVIFISSAVGGTTLYNKWLPPSGVKRLGGEVGPLYTRLLAHTLDICSNIGELYPRYKGQGYELAGIIWFQGENDCCANTQGYYQDLLVDFINDLRKDLGVPDLPFFIPKINDGCWEPGATDVRRANEYVAHTMKNVEVVHTHDLRQKCHYNAPSYITISQRLAKVMLPYCKTPVHIDTKGVEAAAKIFYAQRQQVVEEQDMTSLKKGLVDYFKFDDPKASSSVNNREGIFGLDPKFGGPKETTGKFGNSFILKGKQSITLPGYADPLNKDGMIDQLSISFWARTSGGKSTYRIGKGEGRDKIESLDGDDHNNWWTSLFANKRGWDVRGFSKGNFGISTTVKRDGVDRTFGAFTTSGFAGNGVEWIHMVVTYDGIKGETKIYKNGELCKNKRSTDLKYSSEKHAKQMKKAGNDDVSIAPIIADVKTALVLGGNQMEASTEFHAYDELAIWSRLLTEEEVHKLYNNGGGSEIPAN